jgi:hypothetical protein
VPSLRHRHQPITEQRLVRRTERCVLQPLCRLRRVARLVAVTFGLLPFLLNTAAACGFVPEFDCCPDNAAHVLREQASGHTVASAHPGADFLTLAPEPSDADSADCGPCDCEYCKGFFLAHLSGIPVAIIVSDPPQHSVVHTDLRQIALEFVDAPPVPPP